MRAGVRARIGNVRTPRCLGENRTSTVRPSQMCGAAANEGAVLAGGERAGHSTAIGVIGRKPGCGTPASVFSQRPGRREAFLLRGGGSGRRRQGRRTDRFARVAAAGAQAGARGGKRPGTRQDCRPQPGKDELMAGERKLGCVRGEETEGHRGGGGGGGREGGGGVGCEGKKK